jgi:glutamyl-tRNA(Gln) amidotransferase subunit E
MGLDPALASQIASSEQVFLFEQAVGSGIPPPLAARTLLSTLKELSRAGTDVSGISDEEILAVLSAVRDGRAAKEAVPSIFDALVRGRTLEQAIAACAPSFTREEMEMIVRRIVEERRSFVVSRGKGAVGPLMGVVMAEVRGSVDGKLVSEVLSKEIDRLLAK